jgi:hypothetical protein
LRFEEDDEEDEDLDSLDDGEESYDDVVLGYRDLLCREIVVELVSLTTDEMLDFLSWELDRYGFSDKTELELISIEFDKQYILGFWNLREEAEVRTATGAGNMHCFIDTWVLKNLSELIMDKLYGQLAELELDDLIDPMMHILLDVVQWKTDKKIPLIDAAKCSEDDDEPTEEPEPD